MLVQIDGCGDLGVSRDAFAPELPNNAWSDARNVRFREGYAEKMRGHSAPFGTPSVKPFHVQPLTTGAGRYWLYAGLHELYYVDTFNQHNKITRAAGTYSATEDMRWNGGTFAGIAILNNGVDVPQYWAGSGLAQNLTAWPATYRAKVIRPFRQFLLALNVTKGSTNYPHLVAWSHSASDPGSLPTSWDITDPTLDAGEYDLADDQTVIVDGLALGDSFIVYKESAYYLVRPVGPPRIFEFYKLADNAGALGPNCVATFPGGHVVLGQGDIWVHSGGPPRSILDRVMRRWLFGQLDADTFVRSFIASNPLQNEVWCCFPVVGGTAATLALIWNWKDNTFTVRELPGVAHADFGVVDSIAADAIDSQTAFIDDETRIFDAAPDVTKSAVRLMMASPTDTQFYLADQSKTFNGTAMTAYVRREGLGFGAPKRTKMLKSVVPVIEAPVGTQVEIRTGATMDPTVPTTWNAYQTFTVGTDIELHQFAHGRYLAVEFRSTSVTAEWRLKRYGLDVDVRGSY